MPRCEECARTARVTLRGISISSPVLFVSLPIAIELARTLISAAREGGEVAAAMRSEAVKLPFEFAGSVLMLNAWFHYRHESRPRTRYWLGRFARLLGLCVLALVGERLRQQIWP